MTGEKQEFEVLRDGFILGDFYKAGEPAHFVPEQVKFQAEPYGDQLKLKVAKKSAPKKTAQPAE